MNLTTLLEALEAHVAAIALDPAAGKVRLTASAPLPPHLLEALGQHKPALLALGPMVAAPGDLAAALLAAQPEKPRHSPQAIALADAVRHGRYADAHRIANGHQEACNAIERHKAQALEALTRQWASERPK